MNSFEFILQKRDKGNNAENIASDFLVENGFKIIKRNFTFGKLGEIDIIAEKNNVLVFCEVRSRFVASAPDPRFSINYSKQAKLRKTAEAYLYVNKIQNKECRFDVIIIDKKGEKFDIDHLVNAM